MTSTTRRPAPLAFKPDLEEAARRWEAFYAGEIIDRPIVCVTAPKAGVAPTQRPANRGYRDKVFGDIEDIITRALVNAEATFYGGETIPTFSPSFGPDEIAVFCGAEFAWSADSPDTNWSVPFVHTWEEALPLRLREDSPLWQRMLQLYRRAAERMAGKMLISSLDLHTNMDLLAGIRGSQRLCMDLLDCPEWIDRAMLSARAIFPQVWRFTSQAGRMDEFGYCHLFYSMEGAAVLQCDFSCMISPQMFRRWVLPALEEEAQIVKHAFYHWDGPGALVHLNDLAACRGIHTLGYVPGAGRGDHFAHLELLKRVQAAGKAVHAAGSPAQLKLMHRELRPEKVLYTTSCRSQAEAEELLEWFVKNT